MDRELLTALIWAALWEAAYLVPEGRDQLATDTRFVETVTGLADRYAGALHAEAKAA